jgi:hypothetical protein
LLPPDAGTPLAAANTSDEGDIVFRLEGPKFGMQFGSEEKDTALWERIEELGNRLGQTYGVVPTVSDPDFVTGGPRAPGTSLPPNDV